jgi:hypothetical protein
MATMLFVFPGVSILAGALLARGTMYPRFFFALAGFGLLIGVRGIFTLTDWMARRASRAPADGPRLGSAVVGVVAVLSLFSLAPNYRYPKQDFVGALHHIEAVWQPGDTAAVTGVTDFAFRRYLGRDWPAVASPGDLATLRRDRAVWIAWAFPRYLAAATPGVLATLDQDCTRRTVFRGTVGGGDVHVCRLERLP